MIVSQKTEYALRALYELATSRRAGPRSVADIAQVQAIPPRFLEAILGELRRGGFVESRRGARGGYLLARRPREVTVGEVVRFVQGPRREPEPDPGAPGAALAGVWQRVEGAVDAIYDGTSLADVVADQQRRAERYVPDYVI